jgi:two-component system sensor histidine kinase UhpB
LAEAREFERSRIARELHDELGPILSLVRLNLAALQRGPLAAKNGHLIGEGLGLLDQALEQVRTLSFELGPGLLDELGLAAAVTTYAERVGMKDGLAVNVTVELVDGAVTRPVAMACFRVLQEAVTNVVRHAAAQSLEVRLGIRAGALELLVTDDGAGFDPVSRGKGSGRARFGLDGMRERARTAGGSCTLASAPGAGTVVCGRFPLRRASRTQIRETDPRSHSR